MSRPPCGSYNAYTAHKRRGEDACDPCKAAAAAYEKTRRDARTAKIAAGEIIPPPARPKAAQTFINEVEHLTEAGEGWARITKAFNTTPAGLERRLMRHGRHDLATRIFGTERYNITQGKAAA